MSNTANEFWIIEVVPVYFNFRKTRFLNENEADYMLHEVNAVVWYSGECPWDERLGMIIVPWEMFSDYAVYDEACFKGQNLYYIRLNDIDLNKIENPHMRDFITALLDEREWTLQLSELSQAIDQIQERIKQMTESRYVTDYQKMANDMIKLQDQKHYLMLEGNRYLKQKREAQMEFLRFVIAQSLGKVPPQAEALLEKGNGKDSNYWMFALFFAKDKKRILHELKNPQRMVE